jgi:hypothetical protein
MTSDLDTQAIIGGLMLAAGVSESCLAAVAGDSAAVGRNDARKPCRLRLRSGWAHADTTGMGLIRAFRNQVSEKSAMTP